MKSRNRLVLMVWLTLVASTCLSVPSSAQKNEVAALSARIAELNRAGKYAEAIPLAQRQLESLEKANGPFNRDVAAALNNLALLYGAQGNDTEAEPLRKGSIPILEKVYGLASSELPPQSTTLPPLTHPHPRYPHPHPPSTNAP